MQYNVFARAAAGIDANHPTDHDLILAPLSEPFRRSIQGLSISYRLYCYQSRALETFAPFIDVFLALGAGCGFDVPSSDFFVPPGARINVPMSNIPIVEPVPENDRFTRGDLERARDRAKRLLAHRASLPPKGFDMCIPADEVEYGAPIGCLIDNKLVDYCRTPDGEYWVCAAAALDHVPPGESLYDPGSEWFRDNRWWADHAAVDRLLAEHRAKWPEVYPALEDARMPERVFITMAAPITAAGQGKARV